jgi:hypothetical protein
VGKPTDVVGEEIEAGHLYRTVPNWDGYWDYERNVPEPRAFRKDGDVGVSMVVAERLSIAEMFTRKPKLGPFAVCEFVIEELRAEDGVWVTPDPDEDFGDAHALVMGITKRRIDWLRDLAVQRIVKYPEPMKPIVPH